jgi:hypothetical protein
MMNKAIALLNIERLRKRLSEVTDDVTGQTFFNCSPTKKKPSSRC